MKCIYVFYFLVNYGRLLLQALFEEWKRYSVTDQPPLEPPVNAFFSIAGHTPCVIGEQGELDFEKLRNCTF